MQGESKRIFVPNLPEDLGEDDVRQRFFKFGDITSIEIKHRKDLNARNHSHKYAFINIDTDHQLLQQCFEEFTNKKWNGNYVEVQLAKESFLERLKKEREAADKQKSENVAENATSKPIDDSSVNNSRRKRCSNDEADECSPKKRKATSSKKKQVEKDSDDDSDSSSGSEGGDSDEDISIKEPVMELDLIYKNNKHKAISSKIEGVGLAPIHVQQREVKRKSKDPHREKADQKRINSMLKIRKGYMQQKSMIKKALSNIDGQTSNKKIVFNDDEDDDQAIAEAVGLSPPQTQEGEKGEKGEKLVLFDGDDDEEPTLMKSNFKLREEYEGKRGKKLFEMQTRFNQDERFKMDARFAEEDTSDDAQEDMAEDDDPQAEERTKQLEILGEVLKRPMTQTEKTRKTMRRFDPSQPEHAKYEMPAEKEKSTKKKHKSEEAIEEKLPEVSAKTFYEVSEKIPFQESGTGETFSFLKTFGRDADDTTNVKDNLAEAKGEMEQKTKKRTKNSDNPFKYDSSDAEDDDKVNEVDMKANGDNEWPAAPAQLASLPPDQLWTRRFFFQKNDYRFQEGIDFVRRMAGMDADADFSKTRRELKKIVKRKVGTYKKKKQMFRKKLGSSANKRRRRVTKALHRSSRS